MKIQNFTNRYPISKTIRFELIPEGKTEENLKKKGIVNADKQLENDFLIVKKLMDRYHRKFINDSLEGFHLEGVERLNELMFLTNKTNENIKEIEQIKSEMYALISDLFKNKNEYKSLFGQEMINELLPSFLSDKEEIEKVKKFKNLTVRFTGFNENRKNIYKGEGNPCEVAYRVIDENLPKYLRNIRNWNDAKETIGSDVVESFVEEYKAKTGINFVELFKPENYDFVLKQEDIEIYNNIIGGYSPDNASKVKGINELINEYNQNNGTKLIKLQKLYKQILSETNTISFVEDTFKSDDEVLDAVKKFMMQKNEISGISILEVLEKGEKLFNEINTYNWNGIFINNGVAINDISSAIFDDWSVIRNRISEIYDLNSKSRDKESERYKENKARDLKKIKNYSLNYLQEILGDSSKERIADYYINVAKSLTDKVRQSYSDAKNLLNGKIQIKGSLCKDENASNLLKSLLDSIKALQWFYEAFDDDLANLTDSSFYAELLTQKDTFSEVTSIYNKTRNYVTKKPYSESKFKITFNYGQLLNGWDKNKEKDYLSTIIRDGNKYYLGIIDVDDKKIFENNQLPKCEEDLCEKMVYKLVPDPSKTLPHIFFSKKGLEAYNPSERIRSIYKNGSFKRGNTFKIEDCHLLIDYYKDCIKTYGDWSTYGFKFTETSKYTGINDFYKEVSDQGYKIRFDKISKEYIDELVENGKLYLFRIYNKDFSEFSKGKKNLHTLYFEMLFNEKNLEDVVYQLNGGAEMFYREASLKRSETAIHKANKPIKNKNPLNSKKESIFEYEIIKNRRYTQNKYFLHLPIKMNYKSAVHTSINNDVKYEIKKDDVHIIGIDRGERNLLYVSVINEKGEIVEQRSLNIISHVAQNISVDYHKLLDAKEKERDVQRKSWKSISNIKDLKEGYVSQAVYQVVELVQKYNALISLEDLNSGFKNSRVCVEKQVYQKFENMLIEKLRYLVNKSEDISKEGGLLKAYQLVNKEKSDGMKQDGIIFYIPPWLTSKIDPTTGFVNLLNPFPKTVAEKKKFIESFDSIKYCSDCELFVFELNYNNFSGTIADYRKRWTLYSYGERIEAFRNKEKNSEWDYRTVWLTTEFKRICEKYELDIYTDIRSQLIEKNDTELISEFIHLIKLMLQMRNSSSKTDEDYIISPVKGKSGEFFDSRKYTAEDKLPCDADANGAYHIAMKALWIVKQIKCSDNDSNSISLSIRNSEWLKYMQSK